MIKQFHEILLKDVILLDATKSATHLKKYWFIPLYFCRKELEALTKQMIDAIGGSTIANLEMAFERAIAYQHLQILDALKIALLIETNLRGRVNALKLLMDKELVGESQFQKICDRIAEHTGIEIKEQEDFDRFAKHCEFKIDKFRENFPEKQPAEESTPVSLSRIIYSVFNYMAEPYDENMRLITFIEMKSLAEERIKNRENGQ
jgi:hypothetical protein